MSNQTRSSYASRTEILAVLGGLAIALVAVAATIQSTRDLRTALFADQRDQIEAYAHVVSRDANRIALSIQTQFDDIERAVLAGADRADIEAILNAALTRNVLLREIALLDTENIARIATNPALIGAKIPYAEHKSTAPTGRIRFGEVLIGRSLNAAAREGVALANEFVPVTRAVRRGDNVLTLVASVSTVSLGNDVSGVLLDTDVRLSIHSFDGTPIFRRIPIDAATNRIFGEFLPDREAGVFDAVDTDGRRLLVAYRVATDYPLVAELRRPYAPIESRWRSEISGSYRVLVIAEFIIAIFTTLVVISLRRLRLSQESLANEQQRLRNFAEVTAEWFWETGPDHRFTFVSDGIRRYGIDPESRIGCLPLSNHDRIREESNFSAMDPMRRHEPFKGFIFTAEYPGLGERSISVSGIPIFDASGTFRGFRGTSMDVSEQILSARRLIEAKREAENANRAKGMFFASMSHEIRTPINGILGLTTLLSDTKLDPKQRGFVSSIRDTGEGLSQIINDILDLSKFDEGQLKFEEIVFDPRTVVESSLAVVEARIRQKGLSTRVEIDRGVPDLVRGDPGRLRQILLNLLSNAVKFTDSGEIGITLEFNLAPDGRIQLEFSVSDTGIGIAPDKIGLLFRDFEQLDVAIVRRFGGTGLGLAICRRLVSRMGGEIIAQSTLGNGTKIKFHVLLGRVELSKPSGGTEEKDWTLELSRLEANAGRKLQVLVAEDNEVNLLIAVSYLQSLGFECESVVNGRKALEAVRARSFDLVIMDLQMPEMDGCEAASAIRGSDVPGRDTPIIALTANAFEEDRIRAAAAGMDAFLAKPFSREALIETVARELMRRKS